VLAHLSSNVVYRHLSAVIEQLVLMHQIASVVARRMASLERWPSLGVSSGRLGRDIVAVDVVVAYAAADVDVAYADDLVAGGVGVAEVSIRPQDRRIGVAVGTGTAVEEQASHVVAARHTGQHNKDAGHDVLDCLGRHAVAAAAAEVQV
jgi:hypothetical protein